MSGIHITLFRYLITTIVHYCGHPAATAITNESIKFFFEKK